MKSILITIDQAYYNRIIDVLDKNNCRGFSYFEQVQGRGSKTGNPHYLHVARLSAHNSKQSMNWDQTIWPGQPKGLQMEAFPVNGLRREGGVYTCLNWNYAAHLDPMFRFKDAFGTPDLEEVEKMSWEERKRLNFIYSQVQSANWGQETEEFYLYGLIDGIMDHRA